MTKMLTSVSRILPTAAAYLPFELLSVGYIFPLAISNPKHNVSLNYESRTGAIVLHCSQGTKQRTMLIKWLEQ